MANNIKAGKIKKRDLDDDILEWLNKLSTIDSDNVSMNILNKKITDLQNEAVMNTSLQKTLEEYFNKKNDKVTSSIVDPSFINDLSARFMPKDKKVDYSDLSSQLSSDIKSINSLVSGNTLSSIQGRIASLENLTKDIKSISDNIGSLNLANLSLNVNNLNTDVEICQSDLSNLNARTTKCEQLEQTLATANTELQNSINLLKAQINGISNNKDNTNQSSEKDSSDENSILKMIHVLDANDDDSDDKMNQLMKKEVPYILVLHSDNGYGVDKTVFWTGSPTDSKIHGSIILTGTKYTGKSSAIFLLKIISSSANDNPSGAKFCWCKVNSEEEYIGKINTLVYSNEISVKSDTDYTLSDGIAIRFIGGGFQTGDVFAIKASPNEDYSGKLTGAKKFSYTLSNIKDDGSYTDWKLVSSINNRFVNIIDYGLYYNNNGILTEIFSNAIKKINITIKQGATVEEAATESQFYQAKLYCFDDNNRKISAVHYVSMAYDNKIYLTNNSDKDIDVILEMPIAGGDLF